MQKALCNQLLPPPTERMPLAEVSMTTDFSLAVARISEAVMFENWLRFYFISEEEDKLFIRLPAQALEQLQKNYVSLFSLAERLNNCEIDHRSSMDAVCMYVASEIDSVVIPEALMSRVFDSEEFHVELQLFSSWVQSHEEQLDEAFMEFSQWKTLYLAWKASDDVKQFRKDLANSLQRTVTNTSGTTQ